MHAQLGVHELSVQRRPSQCASDRDSAQQLGGQSRDSRRAEDKSKQQLQNAAAAPAPAAVAASSRLLPPLCPRSAHLDAAATRLPLHKLSAGDAAVTASLVVT